ncbi:MAG: hypothetical protein WC881_06930 [Elusimicrobiota bacterium]|jgi:hypothetical protein
MHARNWLAWGLAAAALWTAGCATLGPVAQQSSPSLGLVMGSLEFAKISFPFPDRFAGSLHLAPLLASGEVDYYHPLSSDCQRDGQVYFFNVPAGRYVLLGGSYLAHGLRYSLRFKPEQMMQTKIEVKSGEVRFLGIILVKKQFRDWWTFIGNVLQSAAVLLPPWRPRTVEVDAAFKTVDRTSLSEIEALTMARRHLSGTLWAAAVGGRLSRLGGPLPDTPTEGFWRKTVKPVLNAESFSWVDTLQWGPPRALKDGLEWRQPQDRARIAVRLVRSGSAGFKPQADYLQELKDLGSPEDTHVATEVLIGTRTAQTLRYTKYLYPEPYLVGSVSEVFSTEVVLVPENDGYYVLYYRARKNDFDRFYAAYLTFRLHLQLMIPAQEAK